MEMTIMIWSRNMNEQISLFSFLHIMATYNVYMLN